MNSWLKFLYGWFWVDMRIIFLLEILFFVRSFYNIEKFS